MNRNRVFGLSLYLLSFFLVVFFFTILVPSNPDIARLANEAFYAVSARLPQSGASLELPVPLHLQEHSLSCEIAALRMALEYQGAKVSESRLLELLPFDTYEAKSLNGVWGDPNKGFVGDIDGVMPTTGYGVYELPLQRVATYFRNADILRSPSYKTIVDALLRGNPVVIWSILGSGRDISWKTESGKQIQAAMGEHTRVVTGFVGDPLNPQEFILLDPIYGKIRQSREEFLKNWAVLGNKALVVYKERPKALTFLPKIGGIIE